MNIEGINASRNKDNLPVISPEIRKSNVSSAGQSAINNVEKLKSTSNINRIIHIIKNEFTLSKRIFLSLFSRKYKILTDLTPFFGNTAMENLGKHEFLKDNSPENRVIREKMLDTLENINQALRKKGGGEDQKKIKKDKTNKSYNWQIDNKGTLEIVINSQTKTFRSLRLNKDTIEDYVEATSSNLSPSNSNSQAVSLRVSNFIDEFKSLNIDEKHIKSLLEMEKNNITAACNTLEDIVKFLKNPENKNTPCSVASGVRKRKTLGWSINSKGDIYIRTKIKLGLGSTKKFTKLFCLNNGKIFGNAGMSKGQLISGLKGKYPDNSLEELEKKAVLSFNESTRKNNENIKILNSLGIPNIPKESIEDFKIHSKSGNTKIIATHELFDSDAQYLAPKTPGANHVQENKKSIFFIMTKMSETLSKLHDNGYCHGDVKPLNISLNYDKHGEDRKKIKEAILIDFDGMKKIGETCELGTAAYLAPECDEKSMATSETDAYALGVTFAHFLFGGKFIDENTYSQNRYSADRIYKELENVLGLSEKEKKSIKEILQGLLKTDPKERVKCAEAKVLIDNLMSLSIQNDFKNLGLDEKVIQNATKLLEGKNKAEYNQTLRDVLLFLKNPENKNKTHSERSRRGEAFGWSIDLKGNIFIRTREHLGEGANKKYTKVLCLNNGKVYGNASPSKRIPSGLRQPEFEEDLREYETEVISHFNALTVKNNENIKMLNTLGIPNIPKESKAEFEIESKLKNKKIISTHKLFDADATSLTSDTPNVGDFEKNKKSIFFVMEKMSETLCELHKEGLYHGDVKPLNIGVNFDENKKIKDVILFDWDDMKEIGKKCTSFGTKSYWAPECHTERKEFIPSSEKDAYALGVTFAQFLFGGEFIKSFNPKSIESKLNELEFESDEERNTTKEILLGLLQADPKKRMTCEKAHSLIAQNSG